MKDINILINNGVDVNASLEIFGDMELYDETIVDFLNSVHGKLDELKNILNNYSENLRIAYREKECLLDIIHSEESSDISKQQFNEWVKKYKEVGDMNNYAILVHSLKSDAKYLGFTKLAELSYAHELQSKAGNYGFVLEHFDELISEANRIIKLATYYNDGTKVAEEVVVSNPNLKKLLVVDDSDIIRNIIKKIFNNEFEVLSAKDGNEAITMVSNNENLIGLLLDLNMPNVDGFAVLNFFRDNNLFDKVPVAIITGDDSKETTERAFAYSVVDVLNKPFNESNVKRVVNAMMEFK